MKIFTAAPLPLTQDSWDRDITLIYRGLLALGVESKCVRLHSIDGTDFPGIIQTSLESMHSSSFWKSTGADAVVLNSWGKPSNTPIVQAIKDAGAKVLIRLDTNGLVSPWLDPLVYGRVTYSGFRDRKMTPVKAAVATAAKIPLYAIPWIYDLKSLEQFEMADYVGVESEEACERLSRLFHFYHRSQLVPKLQIIRHPSAPDVLETDVSNLLEKEKNIVAVGRWWAHQKNTPLLIAVLVEALKANQEYEAHLIGSGSEVLIRLLGDAPVAVRNRIYIHGPIVHPEVVDFFKKSRICLLTSRYESGPLVASEALCCGCSFFAQDNGGVPLKAIRRIDAGGGVDGNVRKLVRGLLQEMERWDRGEYDPTRIAELAREVFSYKQVASEVQSFFMDGN